MTITSKTILSSENVIELKERFSDMMNFEVFPFEKYPEYVKNLHEYRWKPIIIAIELQRNPVLFWMDSSTILLSNISHVTAHFESCTSPQNCKFYPWMLFDYAGHSIYAATHEKVKSFIIFLKKLNSL